MRRIEVVVPVRNEEQAIPVFLDAIAALPFPVEVDLKVVFVEDSSTDGTRLLLQRLAHERTSVGYYSLVDGFGQGAAITFGLSRSTADAVIMMDVDGSHPVEVLPEMVRKFLDGAQVVQCVRRTLANRRGYRRVGAEVFRRFARVLTGADTTEQNIFFRLVSAEVIRDLMQHPRYWHYLRFPLPRDPNGVLQKIYVDTQERALGQSKYDFRRLFDLAIDGTLSQMPSARLVAWVSIVIFGAAIAVLAGWWPVALSLSAVCIWVVYRNRRLYQPDLLTRMRVADCGNVADR